MKFVPLLMLAVWTICQIQGGSQQADVLGVLQQQGIVTLSAHNVSVLTFNGLVMRYLNMYKYRYWVKTGPDIFVKRGRLTKWNVLTYVQSVQVKPLIVVLV